MVNLACFIFGMLLGFFIEYKFSKCLFKHYYHLGIVHEKNEALERWLNKSGKSNMEDSKRV